MEKSDVYVKTHVDTRQINKARKAIERLEKAIEKVNSLADELTGKEINVNITSDVQQTHRRKGRSFLRLLRR